MFDKFDDIIFAINFSSTNASNTFKFYWITLCLYFDKLMQCIIVFKNLLHLVFK